MERDATLTQVRVLLERQKTSQAHNLLFTLVDEMVKEKDLDDAVNILQEAYDVFKDAGAMESCIGYLAYSFKKKSFGLSLSASFSLPGETQASKL